MKQLPAGSSRLWPPRWSSMPTRPISSRSMPISYYAVTSNGFADPLRQWRIDRPGRRRRLQRDHPAHFQPLVYQNNNYFRDVVFSAVAPANQPPDAVNDSGFSTAFQTPLTITAATLLANDTDPNSDPLSITGVSAPVNGSVVLNAQGNPVFTPMAGFSGAASFTYTASDGRGGTDTAVVSLTVGSQTNQPPDAVNDSGFSTAFQTPLTITAATLLANDTDPNSDPLSITRNQRAELNGSASARLPDPADHHRRDAARQRHRPEQRPAEHHESRAVNGSVVLNAQGNPVFTPTAGFSGAASFTYTASDGRGGTDTATVSLTVGAPPSTVSLFTTQTPAQPNFSGGRVTRNSGCASSATLPARSRRSATTSPPARPARMSAASGRRRVSSWRASPSPTKPLPAGSSRAWPLRWPFRRTPPMTVSVNTNQYVCLHITRICHEHHQWLV